MHGIKHIYAQASSVFLIKTILCIFSCLNECSVVKLGLRSNRKYNLNFSAKKYLWVSLFHLGIVSLPLSNQITSGLQALKTCLNVSTVKCLKKNITLLRPFFSLCFGVFLFWCLNIINNNNGRKCKQLDWVVGGKTFYRWNHLWLIVTEKN